VKLELQLRSKRNSLVELSRFSGARKRRQGAFYTRWGSWRRGQQR